MAASSARPTHALFEFLAYTGLPIGEALVLTWADIDFDAGLIRVHRQLDRDRRHAPLKTEASKRDVVLAPALAHTLRQHWLASRYKAPADFVFAARTGRGLNYRAVGEAFRTAVRSADLHASGRVIIHSLRHTFASYLIASGLDVVFVSRQLGHAHPGITLEVYSHLFAARDHAAAAREALDASHRAINGTNAREAAAVETAVVTGDPPSAASAAPAAPPLTRSAP